MDFEDIEKHIGNVINEYNRRLTPDFEGYSPNEMQQVLYYTFDPDSPITLQKLSEADYKSIPILNQVKYIMNLIAESGEIKLTKLGFLPTKVVADIYQQGFLNDDDIESGISKLYKETDSNTLHLSKILIEIAGLAKKRLGKFSLTKKGEKILSDDQKLLEAIIDAFTLKFNWGYFDGYEAPEIGRLGFGFTLVLLAKYGHEKQPDSFYAKKYFNAYPALLDSFEPGYSTVEEYSTRCYSIRTFERFIDYFGLIEIERVGNGYFKDIYITKTDLFDKLIKVDLA